SGEVKVRRVAAHVKREEAASATQQLQDTLQKTSELRQPEGRDKKTLRRLKKRLNAQRQLGAKQAREAEAQRHVLRRNDTAFLKELQQFLGEDGGSVKELLRDDTRKAKGNGSHQSTGKATSARGRKGARQDVAA
ncbi:hypothetical protein DQ04_26591000, partial [Trypanosoma grayi]|uniref:hypothetical protein n=1 Tax=Trypanosoma grayi TaxID=71804 RepID=UPI0004F422BC